MENPGVIAQALLLTPSLSSWKLDSRLRSCVLLEQPLDVGKRTFKGKRLQKKIIEEGDYEDISRHQCTLYSTETLEALRNLELCPTTSCMNLQDGVVFSFCCACKYWC